MVAAYPLKTEKDKDQQMSVASSGTHFAYNKESFMHRETVARWFPLRFPIYNLEAIRTVYVDTAESEIGFNLSSWVLKKYRRFFGALAVEICSPCPDVSTGGKIYEQDKDQQFKAFGRRKCSLA